MAIYFGETPKERFNKKATLTLDFTKNLYKDSNNFSIAPKSFSEVFSFTRGSTKTGTTKVGLRTAGSNTPVENEWNPVTNNFDGLSIHEQRTNLFLNTVFAGAVSGTPGTAPTNWVFGGTSGTTTVTSDSLLPGNNRIRLAASDGRQWMEERANLTANATYIFSVAVEVITGTKIRNIVRPFGSLTSFTYYVDGIEQTESYIITAGSHKIEVVLQKDATTSSVAVRVGAGTILTTTADVIFDIPQLEQGSSPTPYIPTTTAQVTRQADVCTIDNIDTSDWWNPNEGTFVVEWYDSIFVEDDIPISTIMSVDNNDITPGTGVFLAIQNRNNGIYTLIARDISGDFVSIPSGVNASKGIHSAALTLSANTASVSIDGSPVISINDYRVGFTKVSLGKFADIEVSAGISISKLKYKPEAVSDSELQDLSKL